MRLNVNQDLAAFIVNQESMQWIDYTSNAHLLRSVFKLLKLGRLDSLYILNQTE